MGKIHSIGELVCSMRVAFYIDSFPAIISISNKKIYAATPWEPCGLIGRYDETV